MARIRTIKPEFFRHEALQDIEAANPGSYVMLVFAGLWGHCDSKGRFEWRPRQLKLDILPFLDFNMAETLALLDSSGIVHRYEVDGKAYGEIPSFEKHQRITGKEATEGEKYPPNTGETPGKQLGNTGDKPDAQEGKGKGREEEGEEEGKCGALPASRTGSLCKQLREIGIQAAPHQLQHPDWQSLLTRFDDDAILGAAELAKARKPGERIGINYLVPILKDPPKPPPTGQPTSRPSSGRQARIDNYYRQAEEARKRDEQQQHAGAERDITAECQRVA